MLINKTFDELFILMMFSTSRERERREASVNTQRQWAKLSSHKYILVFLALKFIFANLTVSHPTRTIIDQLHLYSQLLRSLVNFQPNVF